MAINEAYSYKDLMGQNFKSVDASEFNNSEIKGSCFYQEFKTGDASVIKDIFPVGMTGVTFKRCNLDNVKVPIGNTVESDCTTRRIKEQNDWEDWTLDGALKAVEPMDKKTRIRLKISTKPGEIPSKKLTRSQRDEVEAFYKEREGKYDTGTIGLEPEKKFDDVITPSAIQP